MNQTQQVANQFREAHLKGGWVAETTLKEQLSDLTWQQATTKIGDLNTIAALTFHLNYYIAGLVQVFEGGPLAIRDKYSFDCPPIQSQADWDQLLSKVWNDAEKFATLVAQMPDEKLQAPFIDAQYGTYGKNIHATIEHVYYHLGQIVLLKKLIVQKG